MWEDEDDTLDYQANEFKDTRGRDARQQTRRAFRKLRKQSSANIPRAVTAVFRATRDEILKPKALKYYFKLLSKYPNQFLFEDITVLARALNVFSIAAPREKGFYSTINLCLKVYESHQSQAHSFRQLASALMEISRFPIHFLARYKACIHVLVNKTVYALLSDQYHLDEKDYLYFFNILLHLPVDFFRLQPKLLAPQLRCLQASINKPESEFSQADLVSLAKLSVLTKMQYFQYNKYFECFSELFRDSFFLRQDIQEDSSISYLQRYATKAFFEILKPEHRHKCAVEHPLPPFSADIALPDLKVAIEIDGRHHYYLKTILRANDLARDCLVAASGWQVVRLPFFEIELAISQGCIYEYLAGKLPMLNDFFKEEYQGSPPLLLERPAPIQHKAIDIGTMRFFRNHRVYHQSIRITGLAMRETLRVEEENKLFLLAPYPRKSSVRISLFDFQREAVSPKPQELEEESADLNIDQPVDYLQF